MGGLKGLDELIGMFGNAADVMKDLDGTLGTVSFDPHDPASIEAAISNVERIIDERVGSQADNPLVAKIANGLKEQYRQGIVERAAAARLKPE